LDSEHWNNIGPVLNAAILSDEAGKGEGASFTGAFVGMCTQYLSGQLKSADFDYFSYRSFDEN
jgi:xylan 1,4-beta-xylosidase